MTGAQLIHRLTKRLFSAANFLLLQAEKVLLSFEAESEDDLTQLVSGYAERGLRPPSWLGRLPPRIPVEETLSDEEWDAKYSNVAPPGR